MLGQITFYPKNTLLNGALAPPGNFESPVFDCSGADTLVAFLDVYYARGTDPDLASAIMVSEDLEHWSTIGSMSSVTFAPAHERKQFQNLRGWRFLRADFAVNGTGDADFVLEFTGELFRTNAAGT